MIAYYKKYFGIDYVKVAMLFYFDPSQTISIGLETFNFNNEKNIEKLSLEFFKVMDKLWKITDFETLQLYFFKFEFALRRQRVKSGKEVNKFIDKVFAKIASIVETSYDYDFSELKADLYIKLKNNHLPEIFHFFDPTRSFKDLRGNEYTTLFEVNELLKANPPKSNTDFVQYEKTAFLNKVLKDDLTDFVEFSDSVVDFFCAKDVDFDQLIKLILKFSKQKYSYSFLREVLVYYRKADEGIVKETALRLIDPEKPLDVFGTQIFLYQQGNFKNKIIDFFEAFNHTRIGLSFALVRQLFFSFEFCLMQIARDDKLFGKMQVEAIYSKIDDILHTGQPDWSKLRATFHKQISETNILEILYTFLPSNSFCTHEGDFLTSTEEIGLYYLQNPQQYNNNYSIIERDTYFRKTGNRGLLNLEFNNFIMKVFQTKTNFDVKVNSIVFDEHVANDVSVFYDYKITLAEYLNTIGYNNEFTSQNSEITKIVLSRKPLTSDQELFDQFVVTLHQRYNFGQLSTNTKQSFHNALNDTKQQDSHESLRLMPRYLLFFFPAFTLLFLCLSYLLDVSFFKQISYSISPTLNFVALRIATANYGNLLFAAYFINLVLSISFIAPIFSLQYNKQMSEHFSMYYGSLIGRLVLIMLFAPVIFIAVYFLFNLMFGQVVISFAGIESIFSTVNAVVLMYIVFMFYQAMLVVGALLKTSKKIRILPILITISIYLIIGYFSIINQNHFTV